MVGGKGRKWKGAASHAEGKMSLFGSNLFIKK